MAAIPVHLNQDYSGSVTYNTSNYIFYYTDDGTWGNSSSVTTSGIINLPVWNDGGKSFAGYYYNGVQVIDSSGQISRIPTSSGEEWHDQWTAKSFTLSFDPQGGSCSTSSKSVTYDSAIGTLPTPTRDGYSFDGWYKEASYTNKVTSSTTYWTGANATVYAKWSASCPVCTINQGVGSGGTSALYYNSDDGKWYFDFPFVTEFSASNPITPPAKAQYGFLGCYDTNGTTGNLCINADGTPTSYFLTLAPTSDITIYAQLSQVSYKVTVSHSSGSPTSTVFYAKIGATGTGRFYSDDICTIPISSITPPTRELYRWEGAWSTTWTSSSAKQYITSAGAFTSDLYALSITANKTLSYGNNWTQVSVKLTLYASSGWTYAQNPYYLDKTNGGVYQDWLLQTPLSVLPIPSKDGYRFLGYYKTNATTGTLYVAADGTIQSALQSIKAATTIYPQGRAASYTLTLNPNGGTTTEPTIYYDATSGATAFFGASSAVITSVTVPTYTGNSFLGYYTEEQGGTQVIDASGNILSSWVPTATATVYAHWGIDVSIIDVDAGSGSGGTSRFYHRASTGKFYSDEALTTEITSISVPSLRLYNLNGLYTEGSVLAVNASGVIQSTFNPTDEFVTLTATYTRYAYEMKISGGSSAYSAIYRAPGGSVWYSSLSMSTRVTNVGVPTKTGYTFNGYKYGSTTVIDSSGNIISAAVIDADYTANAAWTVKTYTLYFNGNGAMPSFSSKTVTYNQAIGTLPTLSNIPSQKTFDEWKLGGIGISSATIWTIDGDQTAYAAWETFFGNVKDWFNLASSNLIPESSDSGESMPHTVAYNATSESPATETGIVWRNPRVTYRVVGQTTLNVTLGSAFAGVTDGEFYSHMAKTGYMISSVEVHTAIGEAPLVTVSAVANEGFTRWSSGGSEYERAAATPAIQTYAVSIPISPRHRPQNLLSAISGGGELQELTLVASGDPVVVAENGMPCASDMTHGRIEVTARTAAYNNESAPAASNNFTKTAEPQSNSGTGYKTFSVTVRKELV